MNTIWVYKLDGTIQCDPDSKEISLEEMKDELESIAGSGEVLAMEKRSLRMVTLCGVPTGRSNAYQMSTEAWERALTGIVGPLGFAPWPGQGGDGVDSDSADDQDISVPVLISDLIGMELRAYTTGDGLTMDLRDHRVNIEMDPDGLIKQIWFG